MNINLLIQEITKTSDNKIAGIIISGSYKPEDFIKGWSDIDLFIVLKQIPDKVQRKIIQICNTFGCDNDVHIGLSFLSLEEYVSNDPQKTYYKALLMKHGFYTGATVILYGNLQPQTVNWKLYKQGLLSEINFFKAFMRNGQRDLEETELEMRSIKCLNHILYASLLFKNPSYSYPKPTKEALLKYFGDFTRDWDILDKITGWKQNIRKQKKASKISTNLINFAENFLIYFFNKHV